MKERINKEFLFALVIMLGLTALIFWPFFIKNLILFPGDFLLAWYEPWKSSFNSAGTITIAHKPVADDIFRQILPYKTLAADFFKNFSLPLWNPYNGAGMPFMASMHIGYLTIFNIFFVLFSKELAWSLYVMAQPFLIGVFTYLFCRKIGLGFQSALFSSFTFILSGFVITRIIFGEYIYTLSMLPLILYLTESFFQNNKTKLILLLPLTIFFLFVSGQPQVIFYVLIFSFFYFLYRSFQTKLIIKNIFLIFSLFLIGVGLSAIQLIPTLELFKFASINTDTSKFIFERFLLPVQHLITIFIPNYFGNQSVYNYWGSGDYIETISSIGLIPTFFALLSFDGKRRMQLFFLCGAILSAVLTLNWFGTKIFFSIPLPIISTGAPSRIFALTTFSLSILAGYGFNNWIQLQKFCRRTLVKITIFILFLAIILAGTFFFYKLNISCNNRFIIDCRLIALRNTLLETIIFLIGLFIFFLRIIFKKRVIDVSAPLIIFVLIIFLGIYNSTKFLPFSPKSSFLPENKLIKFLKTSTLDGRVFGFGDANIKTDFATYFRFFDPNYYDPLYNKRYGELISYANSGKILPLKRSDIEIVNNVSIPKEVEQRRSSLLKILGVKYLIYKKTEAPISKRENLLWEDNNWYVTVNDSIPHAYLVNNFQIANSDKELLNKLFAPEFNPQKIVLLERNDTPFLMNKNYGLGTDEKVIITRNNANKISLKSSTSSDHLLVVSDNYFPGWKSFVDGKETKIYRANYSFRAIFLPEGRHSITFSYEPLSFYLGFFITLGSGVLFLSLTAFLVLWPKISGNKN